MTKKISQENLYLLLVLLIATLIRIFNFFDLSFMHDELSALIRTKYDSISDVITKGVMELDTHPPLVQLFLYFWTSLFGYGTASVKLPFLILGIASLYYLFKVCKSFGQSNELALVVSLFFAVNQLHLTYSSVARMYITGFFFAMALVYHWKLWLENESKKDFIWMLIFAVLCTYNHHFTLFFVLLVWSSGWFYLANHAKKKYLLAALLVFLTYIPCMYVTYYQLFATKGLDWMAAPDLLFSENFLFYFSHYNSILFAVLLLGLLLTFIKKPKTNSFVILGFTWFLASYLVSYFYSVEVAPVLQYHLLLYVLPFLVLACFNGWTYLFKGIKFIYFGLLVCIVSFYSLIFGRNHFILFPEQPYSMVASAIKDLDKGKVLLVTDLNLDYLDFYINNSYEHVDTLSEKNLHSRDYKELVNKYDYIICASSLEFAEAYFTPAFEPIKQPIQKQGTEIDILQKALQIIPKRNLYSSLNLEKGNSDWSFIPQYLSTKDGKLCVKKPKMEPWGPTYEAKYTRDINAILCLEISYKGDKSEGDMGLAINFYDSTGAEIYSYIKYEKIESEIKGLSKAQVFVDLELVPESAVKLKAFHWKKSETEIVIYDMLLLKQEKVDPIGTRNDSIVSWQNFAQKEKDDWSLPPVKSITIGPLGELVAPLDKRGLWFPSYQGEISSHGVYAFEFEFLPEKLGDFSKVILSVKKEGKTIFYTAKTLFSFCKSDGNTWVKAVIGLPHTILENYTEETFILEATCFKQEGDIIQVKNAQVNKYKINPFLYSSIGEIRK